jgi:hypothetical protein
MDRRGHVMPGMDAIYVHPTPEMRQQLCDYLQQLWQQGMTERYKLAPRSAVPLLNGILIAHERTLKLVRQPEAASERTAAPHAIKHAHADPMRTSDVLTRARRQQPHQGDQGRSRG